MSTDKNSLERKIRLAIWITIIGLVLNGLTAFALHYELNIALHFNSLLPASIYNWLVQVRGAVIENEERFPFMLYGYDWLGFAHILIAILFIGALKDPIKNEWVVKFGMIAAALSVLMALVFERFRSVPLAWSMIDISVGVAAFAVLYFCNRWIEEWKRI